MFHARATVEGELSGYELRSSAETQQQLVVATNVKPVAVDLKNASDTPKSAWWDSLFPVRRFNEPMLRKSMIVLCLVSEGKLRLNDVVFLTRQTFAR